LPEISRVDPTKFTPNVARGLLTSARLLAVPSSSGITAAPVKQEVIVVMRDQKYFMDASNTKGPYTQKLIEKFYSISVRDFAYCGEIFGIPGLKPGIKEGCSIMLEFMRDHLDRMTPGQRTQWGEWRTQNTNTGNYDAYIFLQIFDKAQKEKFERCTREYVREELPNGQVHLSRPEQPPLLDKSKEQGGFATFGRGF
jgi:hypothetical protein